MGVNPLQLKFGTAVILFRDVDQMADFLGGYCFRDRKGKVWLHHGCNLHDFTELRPEYYGNIPDGVKWRNSKRTNFMLGRVDEINTI